MFSIIISLWENRLLPILPILFDDRADVTPGSMMAIFIGIWTL
jgi:hypothetical protein